MNMPDFIYILPLFFVGAGAISLMLISTFKTITIKKGAIITIVFLSMAFFANGYNLNSGDDVYSVYPFMDIFNKMIIVDTFSGYFSTILILGAILTILIGTHYIERHKEFTVEFFSLFLFSVFKLQS